MSSGNATRRVLAIARLTFREAIRRRVVLAALLMSAGFLAIYGFGLHLGQATVWESGQAGIGELMRRGIAVQLLYIGLVPTSFLVAFTAVFASAGTISSELDSGVIYGVLARPIRRGELVLGKFIGLAAMLVAYALLLNGAVVALARWQVGVPLLATWPAGLAILVLESLPLLALALLGSTRLPTLANGVMCTAAYGLGFIGGLIEEIGGLIGNRTMGNIGIFSSLLMPLQALHRMALSLLVPPGLLIQQGGVPGIGGATPSSWMMLYGAVYVATVIGLAIRAFSRRDL
jgi:ABC-type transport system involved in multi-copper enzyme maturation permease subunit